MLNVFVGWDGRFTTAYQVCVRSLVSTSSWPVNVQPLVLPHLQAAKIYERATQRRGAGLWDVKSAAPMSTDFALSRFLVPRLMGFRGWATFCDSDFLWRRDIAEMVALFDPSKAVMVVKHDHKPAETAKMDGQVQTHYPRKNWSSLIGFNCAHPALRALTPEKMTSLTGRELHAFAWLPDALIGELPEAWNWLEGHSSPEIDPAAVHFTRGTPDLPGYENAPYASEWRRVSAEIGGRA